MTNEDHKSGWIKAVVSAKTALGRPGEQARKEAEKEYLEFQAKRLQIESLSKDTAADRGAAQDLTRILNELGIGGEPLLKELLGPKANYIAGQGGGEQRPSPTADFIRVNGGRLGLDSPMIFPKKSPEVDINLDDLGR